MSEWVGGCGGGRNSKAHDATGTTLPPPLALSLSNHSPLTHFTPARPLLGISRLYFFLKINYEFREWVQRGLKAEARSTVLYSAQPLNLGVQ